MPHYANGMEAKVGDFVKAKTYDGQTVIGRLNVITAGASACNGQISYAALLPAVQIATVTLGEVELAFRDPEA